VCAAENGDEAALAGPAGVRIARHLHEVCNQLHDPTALPHGSPRAAAPLPLSMDLRDVRGQQHARRALEVAAGGSHNLLFIGPPGTGKTLLASRLPGILPALDDSEALETAAVTSSCRDGFDSRLWSGNSGRFVARTIRHRPPPSPAAAAIPVPAKSHWRTTAYCFSMSWPNSNGTCSKCCANLWKPAR